MGLESAPYCLTRACSGRTATRFNRSVVQSSDEPRGFGPTTEAPRLATEARSVMPHGRCRVALVETRQQFTFDEVADLYDLHRPGYPDELFQDLVASANVRAGDRVLEVGCGTGQATVALAARGLQILCLELGSNLARRARQNLAGFANVDVECVSYEDWSTESEPFKLIVAAQAFHWISEEVRFSKTSDHLLPDGSLAVFGNSIAVEKSPILVELQRDYLRHAPALLGPPPMNWYTESGPLRSLFGESRYFERAIVTRYPWSQVYTAAEYLGLLSTHSDHRLLPTSQREALHSAIAERIELAGGKLEIAYDANLYVARRAA